MDWEDDAPPELVGTGTELQPEEKPVKVPITIVTGPVLISFFFSSFSFFFFFFFFFRYMSRIRV